MGKSHDLATIADDGIASLDIGAGGLTVGTDQLAVDASGRVTMADQPAISVGINAGSISDAAGTLVYGVSGRSYFYDVNQGITHDTSNGRFTVPVAGRYMISFWSITQDSGTVFFKLRVNGGELLRPYSNVSATGWTNYSAQTMKDLSANDYIDVLVETNSATRNLHGDHHSRLIICLMG